MPTRPPQLVLIDGHALAYRMFFAPEMANFATRQGEPTNATHGFTRTLLTLLNAPQPPEYLAVSFDVGATFRDALYADYKGTRDKMPDKLQVQIERIHQVLEAFNIPSLEAEGYEADDVLGTVARLAGDMGIQTLIITGDRDLLQLVNEHTLVQLPGKSSGQVQLFDAEAVLEKYGVRPDQFVDLKALLGDTSDNIPGVAGIGEKSAAKLLQQFGTLENLYAHLDEVAENRARNALAAGREMADLSHKLSQIKLDVPIPFDLEACRTHAYDRAKVEILFRELEFRTLLKQVPGAEPALPPVDGQQLSLFDTPASATMPTSALIMGDQVTDVHVVQDAASLQALVDTLKAARAIAIDTETTSTDQMRAELVGISLSVEPESAYYIPVGHTDTGSPQLDLDTVVNALRPALSDPAIAKIGHNIKYDAVVLVRHGLDVAPLSFDTMLGEWLLRPEAARGKLGLKGQAFHRLGIQMTEIEALIGKGKTQITFDRVPIEQAAPYAAADADITLRLKNLIAPELERDGLIDLFNDLEMPLVSVLADMEMAGVLVDIEFLRGMSGEVGEILAQLKATITGLAGMDFNLNSTQQLSQILFERLKLPTQGMRKTASGHYSTAADVLESLRGQDTTGMIDALLQYRELEKLRSTYLDALPEMVHPQTGRIHTSYNQTGAVTGRLSSSDPNLQNIPIRSDVGKRIRQAFIAAPGHRLIVADYSQIELRVMAHVSEDAALKQAFVEDQDIHATTAATVHGIPLDQVTRAQRSFAKAVNFGLLYGMGAFRLARDSNLTLAEAEDFIKAYFERFPGVRRYLDETRELAKQQGYLETLLKRRRYFPALQSTDSSKQAEIERRAAEREAINMPIQGSAADIIKLAMVKLHSELKQRGSRARMILQVHDELVIEAPEAEVEGVADLVKAVMESAYPLSIPLKTDQYIVSNWGEAK
jgi:DNA polymerase-1